MAAASTGTPAPARGIGSTGLLARVLARVDAAPGRPAIVTVRRSVSGGALVRRAEAIARRLVPLPDGPVLVAPRDAIGLAAAVLATTACGREAVLVDPRRDAGTLRDLAARIGTTVAIGGIAPGTLPHVVGTEPVASGSTVAEEPGTEGLLRSAAACEHDPDRVLVRIPTSGSTGDPRAIGLSERLLVAMADEALALGIVVEGERTARLDTHVAAGPILGALVLGLTHHALDLRALPPSQVLPWLAARGVTYLHLAPTLLRMLLATVPHPLDTAIRQVGAGGEPLHFDDVALVRRALGDGVTVLHTYASTEAGLVTLRRVQPDEPLGRGVVPAGRVVPGRRLWIDDGHGRAAPVGTIGEVVVEADELGRAPGLERTDEGRVRLRTADLGSLDATGELRLHGRVDRSVKLGLWRVDLRVLEDTLRRFPGVVDAAVVALDATGGSPRRSVAHVVVDDPAIVHEQDLRGALQPLVEGAMPWRFLLRTGPLPTLPSGKVDLARLAVETDARP